MTDFVVLQNKRRVVNIGDLNKRLTLNDRVLETTTNNADARVSFAPMPITVWGTVLTAPSGQTIFDDTNISGRTVAIDVTHNMLIRYRDDVTSETWITWLGNNYNILTVEPMDGLTEFLFMKCNIRGDSDLPVNFA